MDFHSFGFKRYNRKETTYSAIQGVEKGVACSISHTATAMSLASFAVVYTLTSESTLVNFSVLQTTEGHAIVLQLNDSLWRLLTHVVNGILVSQPIRSLHCVVEMVMPMIFLHVPQSSIYPSL